ncbi:NUDIX domain-containing protein [Arthrobacter sp. E3]|uniref:NUDIX domain-containing protein n=1 Tax=Arthrobacter sp. E3 TaxID=517402 RepID=UPI001A944F6D
MKNVLRVSAVCVYDPAGRLLTVRKSGTSKFMHPGGKPEVGESAAEAGSRELAEEVGVHVLASELELMGVWTGTAANESNTDIEATVFTAPGSWAADSVLPAAEIAELRWMAVDRGIDFDDLAPLLTEYVLPLLTRYPQHP